MIFAVIDLGTNTFNLLIAKKLNHHSFQKLFNTKISVKLGEGAINKGYIADVPFQRGIRALKQFQSYLLKYNVSYTFAFATSAVRSASNGKDFCEQAHKIAGIKIKIIDGNEEADLIYYGNRMAVPLNESPSLIMDIGGGSTEFIIGNKSCIIWKQSFLLGAARLLEKFNPSDPIKTNEIKLINKYLKQELSPLLEIVQQHKPIELIGSSGVFDSIIDIIAAKHHQPYISDAITEYPVDLTYYHEVSELIKSSTLKERYQINGLIDMRVDMIVISVLLIDFVLRELSISKLRVSTFSLKEGVVFQQLGSTNYLS
ncbi:MAG: exopolyphosphatase [Bacteroidia bacterium]|nr:exopolyphosphatase [Bacteroidia bacterium]